MAMGDLACGGSGDGSDDIVQKTVALRAVMAVETADDARFFTVDVPEVGECDRTVQVTDSIG
jgi:hypothetical protein